MKNYLLFTGKMFFCFIVISFYSGCKTNISEDSNESKLAAPDYISVGQVTSNSIELMWNKIDSAQKYNIYAASHNNQLHSSLLMTTNETNCILDNLVSDKTYYFWICALDKFEIEGEFSNPISETTFIGCPENITAIKTDNKITISWTSVPNAEKYIFYKNHDRNNQASAYFQILSSDILSIEDEISDESESYTYFYWVKAIKNDKESTYSAFSYCQIKPMPYVFGEVIEISSRSSIDFDDLSNQELCYFKINTSHSVKSNYGYLKQYNLSSINITGNRLDPRLTEPEKFNYLGKHTISARSSFKNENKQKSYNINDERLFWIESKNGNYIQKKAILKKITENCYIWIINENFNDYSKVNDDNKINLEQINKLADKFENIYKAETEIFGIAYKDSTLIGNEKFIEKSKKINILIYDINNDYFDLQTGGVYGYFWNVDFYKNTYLEEENVNFHSNEEELFYIDSFFLEKDPYGVYSTLVHEFQHMLNFVNKYMKGLSYDNWYSEMLSMLAEDIFSRILNDEIMSEEGFSQYNNCYSRIKMFLEYYQYSGIDFWDDSNPYLSYAYGYMFGAWLVRNYGGIELINEIATNNLNIDFSNILKSIYKVTKENITQKELQKKFAHALYYSQLTNEEYKQAKQNNVGNISELKPFCVSSDSKIVDKFALKFEPIILAEYCFFSDGEYYITPKFLSAERPQMVFPQGFILSNLGVFSNSVIFQHHKPKQSEYDFIFIK